MLISSHILDELAKLATHYGFLDGGRLVRQVTAQEVEAACRKCLRATVTDAHALCLVLDQLGLPYAVAGDNQVDIYQQANVTQLVDALSQKGCQLLSPSRSGTRAWRATLSTWWEVSGMGNLLSAGVYRLLRSKVFYVCLAAMFLLEIFFLQGAAGDRTYWNEGLESSYFLYTLLLPFAAAAFCGLFFRGGIQQRYPSEQIHRWVW